MRRPRRASKSRAGLALRDIIVSILVVMGMLFLLSPFLLRMRAESRKNGCLRNLQRVGMALREFDDLQGSLPGYREWQTPGLPDSRKVGWVFPALPFLRTRPDMRDAPGPWGYVFDQYGAAGDAETRGKEPQADIPLLRCPDINPRGDFELLSHYVANAGLPDAVLAPDAEGLLPDWPANGVFLDRTVPNTPRVSVTYVQRRDGDAMTIMLSENTAAGRWTSGEEFEVGFLWENAKRDDPNRELLPLNVEFQETDPDPQHARASSFHLGGVNILMVSGAGRFLSDQTDQRVYVALMTPDSLKVRVPGSTEPLPGPFGPSTNAAPAPPNAPMAPVAPAKPDAPQPTPG